MDRGSNERDGLSCLARDVLDALAWEFETGVVGWEDRGMTRSIARTGSTVPTRGPETPAVREAPSSVAPEISSPTSATPGTNPDAALEELRREIGECVRCPLHEGRSRLVFGEGNPRARLVFVGEGPGRNEDRAGRPFVGAAGQLLTKIIAAMGLSREDVYICNVVKCRPPGNRTPLPDERATCGGIMKRQLEIIRPEVVVALGATAANFLLDTEGPLGALRGRFHPWGETVIMPTYHPAYLLRNPQGKRPVWDDMQQVMARLDLTRPGDR